MKKTSITEQLLKDDMVLFLLDPLVVMPSNRPTPPARPNHHLHVNTA